MDGATNAWLDGEVAGCSLVDERLNKRLRKLLAEIGSAMGQSIPLVCQDWANAKAAYRFFSNERVSEADILAGHFQSTRDRTAAADGPVLVLHDTTEFSYQRQKSEAIGITKSINSGRDKAGRLRSHTVCGILMHSSLAITTEGLPLGLAAVKFSTRKKFKGTAALKKKINPTRIPIEKKESIRWLENLKQSTELLDDPGRCVHVGDRESDIYELFCAAGSPAPLSPLAVWRWRVVMIGQGAPFYRQNEVPARLATTKGVPAILQRWVRPDAFIISITSAPSLAPCM
jgi:Transposase DNA-binding